MFASNLVNCIKNGKKVCVICLEVTEKMHIFKYNIKNFHLSLIPIFMCEIFEKGFLLSTSTHLICERIFKRRTLLTNFYWKKGVCIESIPSLHDLDINSESVK